MELPTGLRYRPRWSSLLGIVRRKLSWSNWVTTPTMLWQLSRWLWWMWRLRRWALGLPRLGRCVPRVLVAAKSWLLRDNAVLGALELPCTWIWQPGWARQRKQVEWSKLGDVEADRAAVDLIPALVPKSDSYLYPEDRDSSKSILYRRPYDSRPPYWADIACIFTLVSASACFWDCTGSEVTLSKN